MTQNIRNEVSVPQNYNNNDNSICSIIFIAALSVALYLVV